MRIFYEEWKSLNSISLEYMTDVNGNLADTSAKLSFTDLKQIWQTHLPKSLDFSYEDFFSVSFSHHIYIISKVKNLQERLFYIKRSSENHYSYDTLKERIASNEYQHQSQLPNNFLQTISPAQQALKAINVFKDEYLLDFINVEELGARDDVDIDERVLENAIVHNIKNFILTFGKDFAFIRNQYHLDAFGIDQFIDLLFFNRSLNCLVAVELKKGPFKTAYLGQLSGYLSILDGFEKKPHENPSISLILCKDMEKSFVDYVIRDYSKPMGVATYKTSKDMSEELRKALPDIESLKKLLEKDDLF